jgi:alkylated DNA repair dioxygenase AlkB
MITILSDGDDKSNINDMSFIGYIPNAIDSNLISTIKDYCYNQHDFRGGMGSFGKEIPRLQRWYQIDKHYFSPTWKTQYDRWKSFNYDNILLDIQTKVNNITNTIVPEMCKKQTFNSCLINYYRDNNDSIKPHSDSLEVFGETPTIAIISIGDSRDIYFKRRKVNIDNPKSLKLDKKYKHLNTKITLEEGSLLIMSGSTQKYYTHEIPSVLEPKNGRYSLTFRKYILPKVQN